MIRFMNHSGKNRIRQGSHHQPQRLSRLGSICGCALTVISITLISSQLNAQNETTPKRSAMLDVYEDINLPPWTGNGDQAGDADICIGSSSLAFTIKGVGARTSDNGDKFFSLKGDKGNKLPFQLYFVSQNTVIELEPSIPKGPIRTDATAQDCADHHIVTATLRAVLQEHHLAASPAGSYSGKVNLIVQAE